MVRRLSEEHLLPQLGEAAAARPFAFLSMLEEDADNVEVRGDAGCDRLRRSLEQSPPPVTRRAV